MQIESIHIKQNNRLMKDYLNNERQINDFVDYPTLDLQQRLQDLQEQTFDRQSLTNVLEKMNRHWQAPKQSLNNIERLKQANSVVVIGGQQAGLLTGPLYTVNKVISLIQYSRKQEETLGVPVIPVFWIAGEDHDFAEINHVNMLKGTRLEKQTISQFVPERTPVSDIEIDHKRAKAWINELFLSLPETVYTKKTYDELIDRLHSSKTYVDFFAKLIYWLFPTEGVVLINSGDEHLRNIESKYFLTMIERQEEISQAIYHTNTRLKRNGYATSVDIELDDTHLFYHLNNERILLKRELDGPWVGKQDEVKLTTDEVINIAKNNPEHLSNNVMTRPLMQEFLFPTLAFIGGQAEIGYWMLLREAFHLLNKNLPPLVPRLSFTYVNRKLDKILQAYQLTAEDVINDGVHQDKMNYLSALQEPALEPMFTQLNETLKYIHQPVRDVAYNLRKDVGQFADRNLYHLQTTLNDLKHRMERTIEENYEQTINDFDLLQCCLQPDNGLQERMWSILPFINEHGRSFIPTLVNEPCSFKEDHFVVYL
ncbi:MAG TPA: bacillithiol biosynthesis cysteine-adding enzyme BshC [Bacillota bacterium]|nr:bacillithiol biosynthesis cysteine-adding enzyme BshC [Bacillota bacterium]